MGVFKFTAPLIFLLLIGCSGPGAGLSGKPAVDISHWNLEHGDIVFRKGNGLKSQAVVLMDSDGDYSHSGRVVIREGVPMVVHAVPDEVSDGSPDRVTLDSLGVFFDKKRAFAGAVARAEYLSPETRAKAASYALDKLGRGVLFDHNYDLGDTNSFYCTELIWKAFLWAGEDLTAGSRTVVKNMPPYNGVYIFPSDILKTNNLSTIYKF